MTKNEQALECCEKVLDAFELGSCSISSALLLCMRIARLLNDTEALIWLQYESGGYPRNAEGRIYHDAWQIAFDNGRGYYNDKKEQVIFTDTVAELEEKVSIAKKAINNFSTEGVSTSGEYGYIAMRELTSTVAQSTRSLLDQIALDEKRLSTLKAKYYEYALKKQIELTFGNVTEEIFLSYRENVDNFFSKLSTDSLIKLQAIETAIKSDNPEVLSQVLTTCRRLFESVAVELFNKYFPDYKEKTYKTKSGKDIDISGDHYLNKLSAVIEILQDKSVSKTLIGSNILYLVDRMEQIHSLQCKGVHSKVSKQDAQQCIIQTYICLGDIISMQE
ncbi:MAG: hypothetical protein IJD05_02910 [Bacteroidaceae bacterium]|nr:hypothetical protein [Bacteroidaceae bacterium]